MASKLNRDDAFIHDVQSALLYFQLIEAALKEYISSANRLIARSIPDVIRFKDNEADLENAAFERLIAMFERLCPNGALVKQLRLLKDDRNFCAHKALAYEFTLRLDSSLDLRPKHRSIHHAQMNAYDVLQQINDETIAVRGLANMPRMRSLSK